MSDEWPKSDFFSAADVNYLAAIGAIALRYARLERIHQKLTALYLDALPYEVRTQILLPLTNSERSGVLRVSASEMEVSEQVKDAIFYFLRGFSICTENRSISVHSTGIPGETHVHLQKRASGPPYQENRYPLSLMQLRTAADSVQEFVIFGLKLHRFLFVRYIDDARPEENWLVGPRPLPDKPHLPDKLAPHPPGSIHPDDPIPF